MNKDHAQFYTESAQKKKALKIVKKLLKEIKTASKNGHSHIKYKIGNIDDLIRENHVPNNILTLVKTNDMFRHTLDRSQWSTYILTIIEELNKLSYDVWIGVIEFRYYHNNQVSRHELELSINWNK